MTLYLGKKAVCPTKIVVKEVPAQVNNQDITVTENGTYTAEDGYTGLGIVEVNVPTGGGVEIKNQDITVTVNGSYTADEGYTGLGTVNVNVPSGGEPTNRFGATLDTFIGDVSANGELTQPTEIVDLDFSGVKKISSGALAYAFYGKKARSVNLNDLIDCGARALNYAFAAVIVETAQNPLIFSVNSLESVTKNDAFNSVCMGVAYCEPSFKKLKYISGDNVFSSAFNSARIQPDKVFPALEEISGSGTLNQFRSATAGDKLYFSKVKKIIGGASYSTTMNFYSKLKYYYPRLTDVSKYIAYSSGVSEFHFAKAHQALLEACEGYDYKWSGANPDIYFDLMLKITVNGTVYDREHTIDNYTSWSDTDGNLVYTNADTEPDVGTVVYSDQGTTQVGTVTEVE